MQALLSLWSWFSVGVTVVVWFFLEAVLAVVTLPFDRRRLVVGRFFRLLGVTAAWLMPQWRFGVTGNVPRHIPGRTIVVGNHASQADPFLVSHLPWEMKWLSKDVLFRIPFVGWCMWLAGDIPVKRGRATSAGEAMRRCRHWLERGVPVMIFPEGTRSPDGNLLPFKDGAFKLAIDTGAQVLPIAVYGTHTALPKHSWIFGHSRARVTVGKAISPEGRTVDELKAEARAQIEALLQELRAEAVEHAQRLPAASRA